MPGKPPFRIIGVALREPDGTLWALEAPKRHHDVIQLMSQSKKTPIEIALSEQGFIAWNGFSEPQFQTREEAAATAIYTGQIKTLKWPPDLYSEDLW